MTEENEKLKSEEQENQTQTNDSQETQTEQVSGEVQNENQDQKDDRVVRAGHPNLVQGLVEFGHLGRVGCRGKCRSTSH